MMCFLPKTVMILAVISTLSVNQMYAYCARCVKIEEDRAKEQAAHPQAWGYYDEGSSTQIQGPLTASNDTLADASEANRDSNSPNPYTNAIPLKAYSTIYTIFKTKNFLETLDGTFTLFIPTDAALQQLPPGTLTDLTRSENEERLALLVSNHLVPKKLLRKDFSNKENLVVKTISGRNHTLSTKDGKLYIDDIQILRAEPAGYDGVIYVIDKVLNP
jgi:uncharacterized surface protein with fasciclin (FAS1) repeats